MQSLHHRRPLNQSSIICPWWSHVEEFTTGKFKQETVYEKWSWAKTFKETIYFGPGRQKNVLQKICGKLSVIRTQTEKTLNGKMMLLKIEHWKKIQYITNQNFCWGKCYLNQIPDFHTPLMYRIIHCLYSTPISWFMKQLWFQWAYSVYQFWETKQQQQKRAEKKISHSFALEKILSVDVKH